MFSVSFFKALMYKAPIALSIIIIRNKSPTPKVNWVLIFMEIQNMVIKLLLVKKE